MTNDLASRLHTAIKAAGVNIDEVVISVATDRSTWKVRPSVLQAQAQPTIDGYTDPTPAQLIDEDAQRETTEKKIKAVALALWECIPSPTMTKAQLQARAIAIYKSL